jgi:hypothetical protein
MAYKRKIIRKEYDTPKRARFRCLVEQRIPQAEAARRTFVNQKTAIKWLHKRPSNRRTGKTRTRRPPIILDTPVEEMAKWMTGHFNQRALHLQEIAKIHGIKASNNTILAAFCPLRRSPSHPWIQALPFTDYKSKTIHILNRKLGPAKRVLVEGPLLWWNHNLIKYVTTIKDPL